MMTEQQEEVIHTSLCNGLGWLQGYGIHCLANREDYEPAALKLDSPCLEDVLVQILKDGNTLIFMDELEAEDDTPLNLPNIDKNWDKIDPEDIQDTLSGDSDALTADRILQTLLFGEVVFG